MADTIANAAAEADRVARACRRGRRPAVLEVAPARSRARRALRQLAAILVDNAIRHAPAGSRVTVPPARCVADRRGRGPGIDPAHLDQVFERFWRAPDAPGGTGSASRSRAGSPSATAGRSRRRPRRSSPARGSRSASPPPDRRRAGYPARHAGPLPDRPTQLVRSPDGTPIAFFSPGAGPRRRPRPRDDRRPDVAGPRADAAGWSPSAIDRRGRGSGDGAGRTRSGSSWTTSPPWPRSRRRPGPVDVLGHSLGGRIALGASLRTASIRRLIAYERARVPRCARRGDEAPRCALRRSRPRRQRRAPRPVHDRGGRDAAGRPRGVPPARSGRSLGRRPGDRPRARCRRRRAGGVADALALVSPVLGRGSASPASFREAAAALDARLAGAGSRSSKAPAAAHHSHSGLIALLEAFLAA